MSVVGDFKLGGRSGEGEEWVRPGAPSALLPSPRFPLPPSCLSSPRPRAPGKNVMNLLR